MIIECIMSALGGAALYAAIRDYKEVIGFINWQSRNITAMSSTEVLDTMIEGKITELNSTENNTEEHEESTIEEELSKLKKLYKFEYDKFISTENCLGRKYSPTLDRAVLNTVIDYRNNKKKLKIDEVHVTFNNGLKVWIDDNCDYYAFGTVSEFEGQTIEFSSALKLLISSDTKLLLLDLIKDRGNSIEHKIRLRDQEYNS